MSEAKKSGVKKIINFIVPFIFFVLIFGTIVMAVINNYIKK